MADETSIDEIAASEDTALLWEALKSAKEAGDTTRVRAIENRMREVGEQRRFAHLGDDELAARIRGLTGNRAPEDMLSHNPGAGPGTGHAGAEDTSALNRAIKANQKVGVEATLGALLDEWQRRHPQRSEEDR